MSTHIVLIMVVIVVTLISGSRRGVIDVLLGHHTVCEWSRVASLRLLL